MLLTSRYGPLRYSGMAHLLGPVDIRQCRLGDWWLAYVVSPLIDVIDAWLEDAPVVVGGGKWATWRGPPDPSRVVQSLWSGAAAAVHRLACPRPVSGRVGSNDRVVVADVVVTHVGVIEMRRSPAGGQPERPAHRNVDMGLRVLRDGRKLRNRRIFGRPR